MVDRVCVWFFGFRWFVLDNFVFKVYMIFLLKKYVGLCVVLLNIISWIEFDFIFIMFMCFSF